MFYHRHTNKRQYSRHVCAEEIQIKSDGSIKQVEMTSCGLNGGPLSGKGGYPAYIACNLMSRVEQVQSVMSLEMKLMNPKSHPYFIQEGEDREDNSNQYIANNGWSYCRV